MSLVLRFRIVIVAAIWVTGSAACAAPGFVELSDLTVSAPVIVQATVARGERLADKDSPGLRKGHARMLITAAVDAAIVAPGAIPAELTWLWDAPLDAKGKVPKTKNKPVMVWITAPAPDGKSQLIASNAQLDWTPDLDARVRAIATEAKSGAAPVFTGVANGFRADGTVAGESESQFFLTSADGRGATMVVTSRPGAPRKIAMSRGDVIDESAAPVRQGSLLWYRLACFLPSTLPAGAGGDNPGLAADWSAAIMSLGPCERGPNGG